MPTPRRLLALLATSILLDSVGCRDNAAPAPPQNTAVSNLSPATSTPSTNLELSDEERGKLEERGIDLTTYEVLKHILDDLPPGKGQ